MPINISIETKIKPVAFQSLKTKGGAKKIGTDFAIDKLKTAFRESLKKIKTQILENQTEAIGTSLSALVVLDCTTISDTTAGPVCIIIPPGKLGQYNSALKAITMANKSTKEVAICTFNYTGEAGEGDRLLLDFKPTSKAATLLMLKFLNKEGGKVGVQFKVLQGKETEIKVEGEPALEATETTAAPFANEEKMLESLHRQFYEAPSEERLRELLEGMKNFQIVGKKNITIAKPILLVWKAKYQAAKKSLGRTCPNN